MPKGALSRF